MFSIDANNKIALTRGDSAEIQVKVIDKNGVERQIFEDDELTFSVAKIIGGEILISKTITGSNQFNILPEDTSELDPGIYFYDIQLVTFTGKVYTIIPVSRFEIRGEISL